MCDSRPVTLTVGFKPARGSLAAASSKLHDPKLKPKIQGDYCAWTACYILLLITSGFEQLKQLDADVGSALFAQVQFVDQFFVTIGFCFAQIIEQTPAMRDHLK